MAGYTDSAMRTLALEHGAGLAFTEVTNAEGLVRGSRQTLHLLETSPSERPVYAHLYGCSPAIMGDAARLVYELGRFEGIDVNAGCPVRKIVNKGSGVALMRSPALIEKIVRAVCSASPLPVTLKTRLGLRPDAMLAEDVLLAAQAGGAAAVTVHARFASDQHKGPPALDVLARLKSVLSIPVIGNGGVESADGVLAMMRETNVDGVMIGRGAVGNPWVFSSIRARLCGGTPVVRTPETLREVIATHLKRLTDLKCKERKVRRRCRLPDEEAAVLAFRPHLVQYLKGFRRWVDVRRDLTRIRTPADVFTAVDLVLARNAGDAAARELC